MQSKNLYTVFSQKSSFRIKCHLFSLLLIGTITSTHLFAQTQVSGGIFSPETWTLSNSPYLVTGDVVIFENASLTIESGVELRFQSGTLLEVRGGDLYANGSVEAPILFTLDSDDPVNAPKWRGIENTSNPNLIVDIQLSFITLEYAETGVNYGTSPGYRDISHSTFRFNDLAVFDGTQGYNWMEITDCSFLQNGIGIQGRMSAIDCMFEDNEYGIANPLYFSSSAEGGEIINCTFINNDNAIASLNQVITFARVENSAFEGNEKAVYIYQLIAENTIFTGSTETAVYVLKGDVKNCSFSNNAVGLEVGQFPYQLEIKENNFLNNEIGLKVSGEGASIHHNTICNSLEYDAVVNTDKSVDLTDNCWCTNDNAAIASTILDAFDDVSLGIASFEPFLQDCNGNLLFPGDTDANGIVNAWDLIPVGLAFGYTGVPRADATTNWIGQSSENWPLSLPDGLNIKYADADGNGIIDAFDAALITDYYNFTHNSSVSLVQVYENTAPISLSLEGPDVLTPGQLVTYDLMLADPATPVADLYGLALSLRSDLAFFEPGSFQLIIDESWIGNPDELLTVNKELPQKNRTDIAFIRKNQQAAEGGGKIASFSFVVNEEILEGLAGNPKEGVEISGESLNLLLKDVEAVTSQGKNLLMNVLPFSATITDTYSPLPEPNSFSVFPNPAKDVLSWQSQVPVEQVRLTNLSSQISRQYSVTGNSIYLENLPSGIYILQAMAGENIFVKKVIIK
jgi:hypothetical protein